MPKVRITHENSSSLPNWRDLVRLPDCELANVDIAVLNLACAEGLPGAERIDVQGCLKALDAWAMGIAEVTERAMRTEFVRRAEEFQHNEPLFRMARLVTLLQNHCGVTYNPAKIPHGVTEDPIRTDDEFIHGVVQGPGGTCASLPVVFTAVARRIGYPVFLVCSGQHVFCRWEDPFTGQKINIEGATTKGLNTYPDEHYRHGRYLLTPDQEEHFGYLRSQTPREDLLSFLYSRSIVCAHAGYWICGVEACYIAAETDPHQHRRYMTRLAQLVRAWGMHLRKAGRIGPGFVYSTRPDVMRRWPKLPWEWEAEIRSLEAAENFSPTTSTVASLVGWNEMQAKRLSQG